MLAKSADAQTATDAPSPHPSRQPSTGKPPSAAALAVAATFRAFDAKLTDEQLTKIARTIDDNRAAGAELSPRKKRLRNSDEPVTRFAAAEPV